MEGPAQLQTHPSDDLEALGQGLHHLQLAIKIHDTLCITTYVKICKFTFESPDLPDSVLFPLPHATFSLFFLTLNATDKSSQPNVLYPVLGPLPTGNGSPLVSVILEAT